MTTLNRTRSCCTDHQTDLHTAHSSREKVRLYIHTQRERERNGRNKQVHTHMTHRNEHDTPLSPTQREHENTDRWNTRLRFTCGFLVVVSCAHGRTETGFSGIDCVWGIHTNPVNGSLGFLRRRGGEAIPNIFKRSCDWSWSFPSTWGLEISPGIQWLALLHISWTVRHTSLFPLSPELQFLSSQELLSLPLIHLLTRGLSSTRVCTSRVSCWLLRLKRCPLKLVLHAARWLRRRPARMTNH